MQGPEAILGSFPPNTNTIIYSTQNPTLARSHKLQNEEYKITALSTKEIVRLLQNSFAKNKFPIHQGDIRAIAKFLNSHPLASIVAVSYITGPLKYKILGLGNNISQAFLDMFQAQD